MLSRVATLALLSIGLAAAAPRRPHGHGGPPSSYHHGPPGSWGHYGYGDGGSHESSGQIPFKFPLANGFPNISNPSDALRNIEVQARGTLPNGPLPSSLHPGSETVFELIAFNELFEVAFFTSLINNITNNAPGFEVGGPYARNIVLNALIAVQAQEELHALGANGILDAAGETMIQPCEYVFPSADFESAIRFASTFTDVVVGTLQDALAGLTANGDDEFVALLGSVIGQEGEQNGFYRSELNLIPSALPFLTRSKAQSAFSILNQVVVVPGSCPNANIIDLPIFGALTIDPSAPEPKDQDLTFTFTNNGTDTSDISLVYINQQNLPIVEEVKDVQVDGDVVTFKANLPFVEELLNGLTTAVVTTKAESFATVDEVADATLFGPGLIEIN